MGQATIMVPPNRKAEQHVEHLYARGSKEKVPGLVTSGDRKQ